MAWTRVKTLAFFRRRRRPGGESGGSIQRRHPCDDVYAALGYDLRESGHAHSHKNRRGKRRRRLEYVNRHFAEKQVASFALSARLHGSYSVPEISQGREPKNIFQVCAQSGFGHHGLSLRGDLEPR